MSKDVIEQINVKFSSNQKKTVFIPELFRFLLNFAWVAKLKAICDACSIHLLFKLCTVALFCHRNLIYEMRISQSKIKNTLENCCFCCLSFYIFLSVCYVETTTLNVDRTKFDVSLPPIQMHFIFFFGVVLFE